MGEYVWQIFLIALIPYDLNILAAFLKLLVWKSFQSYALKLRSALQLVHKTSIFLKIS